MKQSEIRKELYAYLYDNPDMQITNNKKWKNHQKKIGKILKKFTSCEPIEKNDIVSQQKKQVTVAKTPCLRSKERDIKNGVWRPADFYK
jgi:hypothetical protein